ncbi:hypothetical protein CEXT_547481 [Caerostris extrusa]|uniref:Uncharacterized protein n=1 Tax=Caerostris extrusa TaxID=172846 RepID=A0AAV4UFY7_CAEEX|nr:hypothetical protein CEXT_547481 [Caerostris extrusa]
MIVISLRSIASHYDLILAERLNQSRVTPRGRPIPHSLGQTVERLNQSRGYRGRDPSLTSLADRWGKRITILLPRGVLEKNEFYFHETFSSAEWRSDSYKETNVISKINCFALRPDSSREDKSIASDISRETHPSLTGQDGVGQRIAIHLREEFLKN